MTHARGIHIAAWFPRCARRACSHLIVHVLIRVGVVCCIAGFACGVSRSICVVLRFAARCFFVVVGRGFHFVLPKKIHAGFVGTGGSDKFGCGHAGGAYR